MASHHNRKASGVVLIGKDEMVLPPSCKDIEARLSIVYPSHHLLTMLSIKFSASHHVGN